MTQWAIGVDLGGSNLRMALYEDPGAAKSETLEPVASVREPVGEKRDPDTIIKRVVDAALGLEETAGGAEVAVGIGFAGMFGGKGFVSHSPHFGWHDVDLAKRLSDALDRRVMVDNDVNVIAYGEYRVGAARGEHSVLAVLAGTGIGGGFVADGQILRGSRGCACEIGHTKVVFSDDARRCHCGKRGCIEAYVGGRNLRDRIHEELRRRRRRSKAIELAGSVEAVEISHIDDAAADGDDYALDLYEEIAPLMGAALANAATLLNPSRLVLGGGVFSRAPVLKDLSLAAMEVAINPPAVLGLSIADTELGDQAGLVGSALLALSS